MHDIPEQAVQAAARAHTPKFDNMDETIQKYALEQMRAALTAASPHLAAVRVKKREWTNRDEKRNDEWLCATDASPSYTIMRWWLDDARDEVGHFEVDGLGEDQFGTLEEAKAAAQADFEDRILSALEPSAGRAAVLEEAARVAEERAKLTTGCNPYYVAIGIAEAIRALHPVADKPDEAGRRGEGWLPIESAPKDGTSILAVCAGVHERTGIPFIPEVVEWTQYGWSNEMWGEQPNHGIYSPTHWRPLPTPPSGEVA